MKNTDELTKLPTSITNFYTKNPFDEAIFYIKFLEDKNLAEIDNDTAFGIYCRLVEIYDRIYEFENFENLKPSKKEFYKKTINSLIKCKLNLKQYINEDDVFELNYIYDFEETDKLIEKNTFHIFLEELHSELEKFALITNDLKVKEPIRNTQIFKFAIAFAKEDGFFHIKDNYDFINPRNICIRLFGKDHSEILYQYMCSNIIGIMVNGKIYENENFQQKEFEEDGIQKKYPPTRFKQRIFYKLEFQENFRKEFFNYFKEKNIKFHLLFNEYLEHYKI